MGPRIGFDVSPLVRPHPRGIVRLVEGLAGELERRGVLSIVRLSPEPGEGLRAWRQVRLPRMARELELEGVHSPVSAFPWRGRFARVQTIHELPWRSGVAENADLRHRLWAALGPVRADRVVCASEHGARQVRRRLLPGASKVRVCPWGAGLPFADEPPPGVVDELVLARYRQGEDPFVLCPGAVREKKNLPAVLRGLAELRRRGGARLHLVVSGAHTAALRRDLGLASQLGLAGVVSTPGEVPETDLPALYRLASAVAVLSHSEGFAFPVLEAMASGTPVVVPRGSAQAELAGEAGIEADPGDAASVAEGLERALRERAALRAVLTARAAEFTWQRSARCIESVWMEIL
ncbi:MAG TPA: glycosyltransferase family 1 protein [Planctomycetota bacterium]|nr:glycosyltransferase family 1 protein [Planctomycetota bacterium]